MTPEISVNGRYLWRNREVVVDTIESDRVMVQVEQVGKQVMRWLKPNELEPLVEDSDLAASPYLTISPEEWKVAKQRVAAMEKIAALESGKSKEVKKAAEDLGLSERQVWRLLEVYEANPTTGAMLAMPCGRPRDLQLLGRQREDIIANSIEETYLKAERPSVSALRGAVEAECVKLGLKTPSARTLKRRIQRLVLKTVLKRRDGAKTAAETCDGVAGSHEVKELLERIEIDHTLIDVILRADTPKREVIGRPWLTVAIDCRSRMILGLYISFCPPSAAAVAMCLAMAALPKDDWLKSMNVAGSWPAFGIPRQIWVDNAMEFRSEALRRGCEQYMIQLCYRPVGAPRYGGIVERLIGTLMGYVHLLPGTTQSSVADLGDYEAEKRATMTLSEFIPWFTEQVVTQYHLKSHRTLGIPPIKQWEQDQIGKKIEGPRDALQYYASFLPAKRRVLTRVGIHLAGQRYWSDDFSPWIGQKKKVLTHFHRMDGGTVYVRLPSGAICIAAEVSDRAKGKTFEDLAQKRNHVKSVAADPVLAEQRVLGFERNKVRLDESIQKTSAAARTKPAKAIPPPVPTTSPELIASQMAASADADLAVLEMD